MLGRKDARPLLLLAGAVILQFAPVLFTGRSYFLGDLTYFYHPWHALSAQMIQSGELPLWNPYGYLGMPLLGSLQTGTFSPTSLFFHLFGFASASKLHLLAVHLVAAFLSYIWLRTLSGRAGAFAGALIFSLGGILLSRIWVPNHAATLAWFPAFFLFGGNVALLAVSLAASLLAGYPQIWAGTVAAALLLPWARRTRAWPLALGAALALSACMLLPGLEFARHSNRASLSLEQRTAESLPWRDIPALATPLVLSDPPSASRYPVWKTVYFGLAAFGAACWGVALLKRRAAALVGVWSAVVLLLALGAANPVSKALWEYFPPLWYLRFPANLCYLLLPAILPLVALGLKGKRWAPVAAAAILLELLWYGQGIQRTVPDDYFVSKGPIVENLQHSLQGHRYAVSPKLAMSLRGEGRDEMERFYDLKHKIYGSSGLPFRISGATGMGESLLLGSTYDVMDFLFTRPTPEEAARYLPWVDARFLLTPSGVKELSEPARARWLPLTETGLLGGFEGAVDLRGAELRYEQLSPTRYRVMGTAPEEGWVFVANPRYPGWRVQALPLPPSREREGEILPALTAFQRVAVPRGDFRLEFYYCSTAVWVGIWISVACGIAGLGVLLRRLRQGAAALPYISATSPG